MEHYINFKGNGNSTIEIEESFNSLCQELERLGNLGQSYWGLHLIGNKKELRTIASKIVLKSKLLQETIKQYTNG